MGGFESVAHRIGVDIAVGYDTPIQVQALVGGEGVLHMYSVVMLLSECMYHGAILARDCWSCPGNIFSPLPPLERSLWKRWTEIHLEQVVFVRALGAERFCRIQFF